VPPQDARRNARDSRSARQSRRTNLSSKIWRQPAFAHRPRNEYVSLIQSKITAQMFKEASAAKTPIPQIMVTPFQNGGVNVHILYWLRASGAQASLSFGVNQPAVVVASGLLARDDGKRAVGITASIAMRAG
jgi:hypothetical protein